jgi:hypothetical protein
MPIKHQSYEKQATPSVLYSQYYAIPFYLTTISQIPGWAELGYKQSEIANSHL